MNDLSTGVVIIGGTGFGAGELLRLLAFHPYTSVVSVVSSSAAGTPIATAHPHLRSIYTQNFESEINTALLTSFAKKVVFSALPHGESAKQIQALIELLPKDTLFIDLSGDLRLHDEATHTAHYPHSPYLKEIRQNAAYGLTELFREEIAHRNIIANPGCLATAAILAVAPFTTLVDPGNISLHLATGSSGAGKDPKSTTHHPVRHANFYAYRPLSHQHLPEIEETLKRIGLTDAALHFVPHSLPVSRGILCTAFMTLQSQSPLQALVSHTETFYKNSKFIRVTGSHCAELENVVGSNFCDLSLAIKGNTLVVHTAIDNLVKGMAGQAIQNMNVMLGINEISGLWFPAVRPV